MFLAICGKKAMPARKATIQGMNGTELLQARDLSTEVRMIEGRQGDQQEQTTAAPPLPSSTFTLTRLKKTGAQGTWQLSSSIRSGCCRRRASVQTQRKEM